MTARLFMVAGFSLAIVGLSMLSMPVAMIIGGTVLFVAGGLESGRGGPR